MSASGEGSIKRTVRVLRALCTSGPLTLTDLAGQLDLSMSTVSRFLGILREEGLVEQCDDRRWRATLEVWHLGTGALHRGGWAARGIDDALHSITEATGETAVYVVYDRGWVTYVGESESPHSIRTHVGLGTRYRATDVISGRLLLAFQPADEVGRVMVEAWGEARWASEGPTFTKALASMAADGYAIGRSVAWEGIWGLSVAVPDRQGRFVTAVGISAPDSRRPDDIAAHLRALRAAADQVSLLPPPS